VDRNVPDVSVILAVNKDDGFLAEALQSVLDQTHRSLELIVVANRCSESLWDFLKSFDDPRIVLLRTNIGQLPFNLNLAIEHARAPLIARMDADDICEPHRIARQLEFFEKNPDVDVVGTEYVHIDAASTNIGKPSRLRHSHQEISKRLPYESCMPHPTVMFRREAVLSVGGYAYGLYAEDWDLWLRMARNGRRFANIDECLLRYRIHGAQSTAHSTLRRNMANVIGLLVRELILTGRIAFAAGLLSFIGASIFRASVAVLRQARA
jgi:glycosyltransferase involved in cell wall biosynthesis